MIRVNFLPAEFRRDLIEPPCDGSVACCLPGALGRIRLFLPEGDVAPIAGAS